LDPEQVAALYGFVNIYRPEKDTVLFSQGEAGDSFYLIARGAFQVTRKDGGDSEVTVARLERGALVGELGFLDGLKRTATVRAATDDACVIEIGRKELELLLQTNPKIAYPLMKAILRSAHASVDSMDKAYTDFIKYIGN
jgi:CRP-like cAMP-binding protein